MELRVPGGGSWLDALVSVDTATALGATSTDAALADVTSEQLDEAIAALARGEIEYLALHDGAAFLQVAGERAGPYQIEYNPGRIEDLVRVPPPGVTDEAVRYGLHAFLAGDPAWAEPFPWEPAGLASPPPSSGGGVLRKLFGRH
jgi:hypothetical protein